MARPLVNKHEVPSQKLQPNLALNKIEPTKPGGEDQFTGEKPMSTKAISRDHHYQTTASFSPTQVR